MAKIRVLSKQTGEDVTEATSSAAGVISKAYTNKTDATASQATPEVNTQETPTQETAPRQRKSKKQKNQNKPFDPYNLFGFYPLPAIDADIAEYRKEMRANGIDSATFLRAAVRNEIQRERKKDEINAALLQMSSEMNAKMDALYTYLKTILAFLNQEVAAIPMTYPTPQPMNFQTIAVEQTPEVEPVVYPTTPEQ